MVRLTKSEARTVRWLAEGMGPTEIAKVSHRHLQTVKTRLFFIYTKLGLNDSERHRRVLLAVYLNCELFQIGLKELGLAA